MTIKGFTSATADVNGQRIHYTMAGSGPPLLLLHGFPQTHAMWHGIAPTLAQHLKHRQWQQEPTSPDSWRVKASTIPSELRPTFSAGNHHA